MGDVVREFVGLKSEGDNLILAPTDDREFIEIILKCFLGRKWYTEWPVGHDQCNSYIIAEMLERYSRLDFWEATEKKVVDWYRRLMHKPIRLDEDVKDLYAAVLYYTGFMEVVFVRNPSKMRMVGNTHNQKVRVKDNNGDFVIYAPLAHYQATMDSDVPKRSVLTDQVYIHTVYIMDKDTVTYREIKECITAIEAMRWRTTDTIRDKAKGK